MDKIVEIIEDLKIASKTMKPGDKKDYTLMWSEVDYLNLRIEDFCRYLGEALGGNWELQMIESFEFLGKTLRVTKRQGRYFIKHKLWCKNKMQWESNDWCLDKDGNIFELRNGGKTYLNPNNHVLVRGTGALDSKGIEVFEGDILEDEEGRLEVFWSEEELMFKFLCLDDYGTYSVDDINIMETTIISNIFEGNGE